MQIETRMRGERCDSQGSNGCSFYETGGLPLLKFIKKVETISTTNQET